MRALITICMCIAIVLLTCFAFMLPVCAEIVSFWIVWMRNGRKYHEFDVKCPGRKPLIEHMRPLLASQLFDASSVNEQRVVFELDVGSNAKANWSSPAEVFAVSYKLRCEIIAHICRTVGVVTKSVTFLASEQL